MRSPICSPIALIARLLTEPMVLSAYPVAKTTSDEVLFVAPFVNVYLYEYVAKSVGLCRYVSVESALIDMADNAFQFTPSVEYEGVIWL